MHPGRTKRLLASGVTDAAMDSWYELALASGVLGGEVTGAGGGGFLLLYCEPEGQRQLTSALQAKRLHRMDFRFVSGGGMVIMNNLVGPVSLANHV